MKHYSDITRHKPVRIVPFDLYNIDDFVVKEHPIINPKNPKYNRYWIEQTKKCLDGIWGHDFKDGKGGYRFMPGNLYFYINMCIIKDEDDYSQEVLQSPTLRDVDWLLFYAFSECEGFSGFEGDEEYTSYKPVGKLERGEKLSHLDKKFLEIYREHLVNSNGEYKKYRDPRKVLYSTFDKPLGKPLYLNEKKNLILMSTRRGGKSYSLSNGIALHSFVFDGAKSFDHFVSKKRLSSTVVVGSVKSDYSEEFLDKFRDSYENLQKNVGAFKSGDYSKVGYFFHPTTGVLNKTGEKFVKAVKSKDGQSREGSGSKIVHVTFHNNPNAAVGHGAEKIIVDEAGLLSEFNSVDAENKAILERRRKFGWVAYAGTGGNMEKIKEIKKAFYNPDAVTALSFKDIFSGTNEPIGLFIPSYYRKTDYKTPEGNTLIQEAWEDDVEERRKKKKQGNRAYQRYVRSFPFVPSEMFVESGTNNFPIEDLLGRKMELEEGGFDRISKIGSIEYLDRQKTVTKFKPDLGGEYKPILEYGEENSMKKGQKEGAVLIYEPPAEHKPKPTYFRPMYIVSVDQVKDQEDGPSLCAVQVFKFFDLQNPDSYQLNIVAEWVGRYEDYDKNHEMAFKLATHYGAKILPETNVTGIKTYARSTRRYHMLQPRPSLALDGNFKQSKKYDIGVYISPGMIGELESLAEQLLKTPVDIEESLIGDQYTEEKITVAKNLNSLRLVNELIAYRRDVGNYDSVSAFFLVAVFYLQYKSTERSKKDPEEEEQRTKDLRGMISNVTKRNRGYARDPLNV